MFSGTIRKNLDPFNEHPDHVLWNALDEVHNYIIVILIVKLLLRDSFRLSIITQKVGVIMCIIII